MADWGGDLDRWLAPFLARLGHKARRRMCPLYVAGLIGPGDRKSVEPMASRWAPGDYDQLHHFISSGVWNEALLEEELAIQADKRIGGASAVLVVDDTALPKKGSHSVGVAPQYASALGKTANCQTLVSLTLARDEVPVMIGLRLFLPESWTGAPDRMAKARVPENWRAARTKSLKSGCGAVGLLLNSGWNWQPRNHGWSESSTISTNLRSGDMPQNVMPASRSVGRYSWLTS